MTATARREPPHHETLTCYANYGCRLPECVERKRAWARSRDRSMRAGTWQPLIDAAPVREHLGRLLEAGLTRQGIAESAGIDHASLVGLTHHRLKGRSKRHRVSPVLAAKILAVNVDTVSAGRVDATGARRRIQALVAAGWPLVHIARQLGMDANRPDQILIVQRIYASTRSQIYAGYERLRTRRPERNGVPKGKARYSRNRGAANRWPTPSYWVDRMDVIDDPDFEPLYGVTRREQIAQDAHWVMTTVGLSKADTADRLGVSKSYIEHAFRDHPQYAPVDARDLEAAA